MLRLHCDVVEASGAAAAEAKGDYLCSCLRVWRYGPYCCIYELPPVSDARKVTEKKAAADAQRQEEAAQKAADAAVFDDQSKCFQLLKLVQNYPWLYGKLRRDDKDNPKRENVSEEIARLFDIVRCLRLQEHQKASPALKLEPVFLNREKGPKREYSAADGYHVRRIFGVRKMSKLIKLQVRKKLGAQWICVRHCLELPQIHSCSHCTLVQPLQDKRPQLPELHPPPITMTGEARAVAAERAAAVAPARQLCAV
ncbi:hypothetical protein ISCGN_001453 [Ixodes scapularis]